MVDNTQIFITLGALIMLIRIPPENTGGWALIRVVFY